MMKFLQRTVLFLLLLTVTAAMTPANVQAASQKAEAVKAYKNMLSKQVMHWGNNKNFDIPTKNCVFTTAYIDNDSVPELIVHSSDIPHWSDCSVLYRYKDGKVQEVKSFSSDDRFSYYKKKGVFVGSDLSSGIYRSVYYQLSKGKASAKLTMNKNVAGVGGKWTKYYSGKKQLTKSQFNKSLKKMAGARKKTKVKLHKNTAGNRGRYLK